MKYVPAGSSGIRRGAQEELLYGMFPDFYKTNINEAISYSWFYRLYRNANP